MDNETNTSLMTRHYKLTITFVLYFCFFVYAINLCITGPTLLDLMKIYNTSYFDVSCVNLVRSFAFTIGSLNGLFNQCFNRQLVFMFFLLLIAITMTLTPLLPSMNMLFVNFAINGFASGGIESASDVWILEMWQQECGPFVQALHFAFALGSVMTSLFVEQYLSENRLEDKRLENSIRNEVIISDATNQSTVKEKLFRSYVYIPYNCGAVAIAFTALIFGGLYCYKRYIPPQTRTPKIVEKQNLKLNERVINSLKTQLMPTKPILILILLSGCLLSTSTILEWAQLNYFPSFAHFSNLSISEKRAAIMTTGLAIAFTIGRGIAIPLSHYLRPKQMIFASLVLLSIANFLYLFFANKSETFMWLANVIYGLGLSSIDASIYPMVEEQTTVNNTIGSLFIFMSGLASSIYPIILGYYIESEPLVLIYFNIIITNLSFVLLISIHFLILKHIK